MQISRYRPLTIWLRDWTCLLRFRIRIRSLINHLTSTSPSFALKPNRQNTGDALHFHLCLSPDPSPLSKDNTSWIPTTVSRVDQSSHIIFITTYPVTPRTWSLASYASIHIRDFRLRTRCRRIGYHARATRSSRWTTWTQTWYRWGSSTGGRNSARRWRASLPSIDCRAFWRLMDSYRAVTSVGNGVWRSTTKSESLRMKNAEDRGHVLCQPANHKKRALASS